MSTRICCYVKDCDFNVDYDCIADQVDIYSSDEKGKPPECLSFQNIDGDIQKIIDAKKAKMRTK